MCEAFEFFFQWFELTRRRHSFCLWALEMSWIPLLGSLGSMYRSSSRLSARTAAYFGKLGLIFEIPPLLVMNIFSDKVIMSEPAFSFLHCGVMDCARSYSVKLVGLPSVF